MLLLKPKSINDYRQFLRVKLNYVEARESTLHPNVEEAVISLTPESIKEDLERAKEEWQEKVEVVSELKQVCEKLKAFIKDKSNNNSPELESKKTKLITKKEELKIAEKKADEKENIFFELLDKASVVLESNYDPSKVKLAEKVSKLLNIVNSGSTQAITLLWVAGYGVYSSIGELKNELKVFEQVKAAHCYHDEARSNKKLCECIDMRKARIAKNALLAIPNITLGTYFAYKQSSLAGKYSDIADVIIEAANR